MKISIITPSLNSDSYIEQAIKSVLHQSYDSFEHIIVDGGSTDGTLDILKKYSHIKWISQPDRGQSDAMNKGFRMSRGDIIVYLNADDYFLPDAFHSVVPYFQGKKKFIVGRVKVVRSDGSSFITDPKTKFKDMLKWWEVDSYCCNPVGYFYRREIQKQVGGFNLENHYSMDLEFLLEASRLVQFTKIDAILGVFRLTQSSKTQQLEGTNYDARFKFCNRYLNNMGDEYRKHYLRGKNRFLREAAFYQKQMKVYDHFCRKDFSHFALVFSKLFLRYPLNTIFSLYRYLHKTTLL